MKRIYIFISIILGLGILSSCDEFFKQESDDVLYADQEHLDNAVDTVYSVTGILKKLQVLGDRTILLGEVRGDLVKLTASANSDLRELADFEVSDDNRYNNPSDYYAVINNCNYFINHADTALRSNRNEAIFMKEYAAVKAIRAWTYLQLVINYGEVPFITEPLLSKEEAEAAETGTKADIQAVCSYFIGDLAGIPERYNNEYPGYETIDDVNSALLFFPLSLVRGDLYLWRATVTGNKEDYRQAALCYFKFISERNGMNSVYPLRVGDKVYFDPMSTSYQNYSGGIYPFSESATSDPEIITMIASDKKRSEGSYSELYDLFCSNDDNQQKVSISPSERVEEISSAQVYCMVPESGTSVFYIDQQLSDHMTGDLRLADVWQEFYEHDRYTQEMKETQYITKYGGRGARGGSMNIHIYRRTMVYLRLAEALNMAGYPRMAFKILSEGLNNTVIQNEVIPYYDNGSKSDSLFLSQFDFNPVRYQLVTIDDFRGGRGGNTTASNHNMIGIHTRGSGWTPLNEYYQLPEAEVPEVDEEDEDDETEFDDEDLFLMDTPELIAKQQAYVDSLILDESALEFAFEGTRYYDIMRYAYHQTNPGQAMAKIIGARLGDANRASMSAITAKLANQRNWFLNWRGKIGK